MHCHSCGAAVNLISDLGIVILCQKLSNCAKKCFLCRHLKIGTWKHFFAGDFSARLSLSMWAPYYFLRRKQTSVSIYNKIQVPFSRHLRHFCKVYHFSLLWSQFKLFFIKESLRSIRGNMARVPWLAVAAAAALYLAMDAHLYLCLQEVGVRPNRTRKRLFQGSAAWALILT